MRSEGRAVEHQPALIDDEEGRRSVEPPFDPVKEIGKDRRRCRRAGQPFCLERLEARFTEPFAFGVEQPSERAADAIGRERLLQCLRLEQNRKTGKRPLRNRRCGERRQCSPQMILGGRIDRNTFRGKNSLQPFGGPVSFGRFVDARKRLQEDAIVAVLRKA